ncbi:MAG: MFS transporter [Woeseiaceae bacterium]|nr:MFS transporter [Woeseiaceae bacterium]
MPQSARARSVTLIIVAGCLISMLGFGARSSFGLFLEPISSTRGWGREVFALALAIQNLVWGIGVPVASALADRFGPSRVLAAGALCYALGTWGMTFATTSAELNLFAGAITGLGVAFSTFSIALAAMVRVVPLEKHSIVLGIGTAFGSLGLVVFSPLSQGLIAAYGWDVSLLFLAASVLLIAPLAFVLPGNASFDDESPIRQSIGEAINEALRHRGYVLLTIGFFVCGFHVAFISVHLPAYVRDLGLAAEIGAYAIAIIGLMNIAGSFLSGIAGKFWPKKNGLAVIYALRAVAITALLLSPKTAATIYAFAASMGLLWLSTVPLTSGIVAQVFGARYMATLFGIVFFGHQLGSFTGVWLGGYLFDRTGTYDTVWWTGVVLSVLAMLIHLPINERPLPRLTAAINRVGG